jgi:hypothetical protein
VALVALSLTGCTAVMRASRTPTQPPAPEAWARTSAVAASEVGAGSYAAADRALADFAVRYPHTPQAISATLRRAVYMADPANQVASAREATALLDSTLAQPLDSASRSDARTLRRITSTLQRAATLSAGGTANASTLDSSTRTVDSKDNSDEIQRLRNELAKANAELERIKKRVAQPKP